MITEVFTDPPLGSPGAPADQWSANHANVVSRTLEGDSLPGLFLTRGTADKTVGLLNDDDDVVEGLLIKQDHLATPSQIDADGVIKDGVTVGAARTGRRCVFVNGAFTPATQAYVRFTAVVGEPVGSISTESDAGKNRLLPRAALRFVTSGEDELGIVDLNLNADADAPASDS